MATLTQHVRAFALRMLGSSATGSLPWIGDRAGLSGPAMVSTTPAAAVALTAVYRCCCLLADAVASQPPMLYITGDADGSGKGRIQLSGNAAARALATISYCDAEMFSFGAALTGNGFLQVVRDGTGAPASLIGIPPWRVSMSIDERGRRFYRVAEDKAIAEDEFVLREADIVHVRFRCIGSNRYWGVPPASTCSAALGLALQSREVQRVLFGNLARPGGVLSAPGKITRDVAQEMQAQWDHNYSSGGAGKVAVLSNGLAFTPILWNAVDAQLLEQVKASVDDVANAYGVPTNFLSSATHLTYASSSEATRSLYVGALRPFVARCADALSRTLLSRNDRAGGAFIDYDLTSILLPPGKEVADYVATMVNAGLLTPNEARNLYLNRPDAPGGDHVRMPPTKT